VFEIEAAHIGAGAKQILEHRVAQVAIDSGATEAENGVPATELA
jgi:hypothetical protein